MTSSKTRLAKRFERDSKFADDDNFDPRAVDKRWDHRTVFEIAVRRVVV